MWVHNIKNTCSLSIFCNFFSAHTVNIWNSLPNSVVDACTVNAFKACLDKFRQHQKVKFYSRSDGYWKPIHKVTLFLVTVYINDVDLGVRQMC